MNFFRSLRQLFRRKPKFRQFNQDMAVEAFRHGGKVYYHFMDSFKIPAGRAICALAIYEELRMRCNQEYLLKHCKAMEIVLSDPKRINIQVIAVMNKNLRERLDLAPFPDHIYKLASVTFFDETESPYSYDFQYNQKKIDAWKKDPEMLDFFLRQQFNDLIPFGNTSKETAQTYFQVASQIDNLHLQTIQEQLSKAN
jgi:hypothetical protein